MCEPILNVAEKQITIAKEIRSQLTNSHSLFLMIRGENKSYFKNAPPWRKRFILHEWLLS